MHRTGGDRRKQGKPGELAELMSQTDAKQCPVCAGSEWKPWPSASLLQCVECTLIVDPRVWKGQAYAKEVEALFFEDAFVDKIDPWQRLFEFLKNRRTWGRLSRRLPERATWLEIGVGSGSLLAYVLDRGMRPTGCDLSRSVCDYVMERYGLSVHCGGIESMDPSVAFDAIIMNHMLEHVPDPVAVLKEVCARMASASWLHIAVPNIAACEARFRGWTAYEPYHLVYFNAVSLRRALEKAGLQVEECTTFEPFSGWFLTIVRTIIGRHNDLTSGCTTRPPTPTGVVRLLYRLLMIAFGLATLPVRWLQGKSGAGEELVVIARRK